jgi:protein-S-isoprenylcysteine O-methyltransferase Ste14
MGAASGYGLWSLVIVNSVVFIFFAYSFTRPKTRTDWRGLGVYSAFIVALFTEMYGFPLTIYVLSGWLQRRFPGTDVFSHETGHLWHTLLGWEMNPHLDPLHIVSNIVIVAGILMLASAWRGLYAAQRTGELATEGLYARLRHPQYAAFIVITFGFLLQWPTLLTLMMFPILVYIYVRLARSEGAVMQAAFGERYRSYAERTPAFMPRLFPRSQAARNR